MIGGSGNHTFIDGGGAHQRLSAGSYLGHVGGRRAVRAVVRQLCALDHIRVRRLLLHQSGAYTSDPHLGSTCFLIREV